MEDVSEIVYGTLSELLEVEGAHPVWFMAVDDLANRIASLVSVGVKDGGPVNGS